MFIILWWTNHTKSKLCVAKLDLRTVIGFKYPDIIHTSPQFAKQCDREVHCDYNQSTCCWKKKKEQLYLLPALTMYTLFKLLTIKCIAANFSMLW